MAELSGGARGTVALADGKQCFNRPGPRLVESLEILAEIFRPEAFDFGHKGRAWEKRPGPVCEKLGKRPWSLFRPS